LWLTKTAGIDAGGATTINKNGVGELIITNPVSNLGADPVLNMNGGTLSLGQAGLLAGIDVQVGGGDLKLASPSGSSEASKWPRTR